MSGYEARNYAQGDGLYVEYIAAGAAVARYQLVYIDAAGAWREADADAVATMPVLGLATQPIAAGQKGRVLLQGFANYNAWTWTPGGVIYASTVTGDLTQTAPAGATDVIQEVGLAITATLIYFDGAGLGRSDSGGTFLGDVDIYGTLTVDTINEHTLNAGVTIEGVLIENGAFTVDSEDITGDISYPTTTPIGDGHLLRARYTDYTPDRIVEWIYDLGNTKWHGVELL